MNYEFSSAIKHFFHPYFELVLPMFKYCFNSAVLDKEDIYRYMYRYKYRQIIKHNSATRKK